MLENFQDIRLLPAELSNQIAAGEVVERPCSVVKELVENSLDAGATQIDICIENGGQSLIRVQDNGAGIAGDQLELAITRHATSKIASVEDLDRISSYGFRGEALPSIASVSRFRIVSRRRNPDNPAEMAASLEVEHGVIARRAGGNLSQGTLIEVRDLFASTPARLKFLKSPATELKKSQTWMSRLALANLGTGFSFSAGEREILRFLPGEDLGLRLSKIWPSEIVEELLPFRISIHGMELQGLAGPPQLRQPKPDRLLFYVNGRAVNDKRLMSAVREAYKGRIISKDYPQLLLFVNVNPMEIDVNAHPAKTEVRFRNEGALFSAVSAALGQAFQKLSCFSFPDAPAQDRAWDNPDRAMRASGLWSLKEPPLLPREEKSRSEGEWEASYRPAASPENAEILREAAFPFASPRPAPVDESPESSWPPVSSYPAPERERAWGRDNILQYLGQVASTYLVLRDASGALLLLDQHAAHERVLYHRISSGKLENGINLIVPLELRLEAEQGALIRNILPSLQAFGFKLSLEGNKISVKCIPSLLSRGEARDFLNEILTGRKESPDSLYISLACRAAIKAGQKLSADEAHELLRQWQNTPMAEFCPHGRPCVLRWDAGALEKLFKRR